MQINVKKNEKNNYEIIYTMEEEIVLEKLQYIKNQILGLEENINGLNKQLKVFKEEAEKIEKALNA